MVQGSTKYGTVNIDFERTLHTSTHPTQGMQTECTKGFLLDGIISNNSTLADSLGTSMIFVYVVITKPENFLFGINFFD